MEILNKQFGRLFTIKKLTIIEFFLVSNYTEAKQKIALLVKPKKLRFISWQEKIMSNPLNAR